jgi:hypothetical protein
VTWIALRDDTIEGTQRGHLIFPNLEELTIRKCPVLTALPEAPFDGDNSMAHSTFPTLKVLTLTNLRSFERFDAVEGTQRGHIIFPNLEELTIRNCCVLTALPRFDAVEGNQSGHILFPNLEELTIEKCCVLTALPEAPFDGDNSMVRSAFPALKVLKLEHLRSFERWDGVNGSEGDEIMFPQLEKLYVIDCEKMTTIVRTTKDLSKADNRS